MLSKLKQKQEIEGATFAKIIIAKNSIASGNKFDRSSAAFANVQKRLE